MVLARRSLSIVFLMALLTPLAFVRGDGAPAAGAPDLDTLGKAAVIRYAANMNAFPYYECRYRCTEGQAKSVKDALDGRFLNSRYYDNRLLIDGEKESYEGFAPPPDPKQSFEAPGKKGMHILPAFGSTNRYLADGKREMNYTPFLKSANLFAAEKNHHGVDVTPLAMGFVGHHNSGGPDVLMTRKDRYDVAPSRIEEMDGRPVVTVQLNDKEVAQLKEGPLAFRKTFSFDEARSPLPVRMTTLWNGKPKIQAFVTNVRECSKQRWFPERTVIVYTPDREGGLYDFKEIKLLELDCDRRPNSDEFSHNIPAGTAVLTFDDGKFFTLKQDEKIGVGDLPSLFEMVQNAGSKPRMDTAVPHPNPYRWLALAGGLTLAVGGTGYLVRRRWRARRATS